MHHHVINGFSKCLAKIQLYYSSNNFLTSQSTNLSKTERRWFVAWFVIKNKPLFLIEAILASSDHCFLFQFLSIYNDPFWQLSLAVHFKFWNYIKRICPLLSLPAYFLNECSVALPCSINILHGFLYWRKIYIFI